MCCSLKGNDIELEKSKFELKFEVNHKISFGCYAPKNKSIISFLIVSQKIQ